MSTKTKSSPAQRLVVSAMLIAIATVLSILKIVDLPYGGSVTLGGMVPLLCAAEGRWKLLALTMAVYVLNALPLLKKRERLTLLQRMEKTGMAAWKRITVLTCFAVFCSILAVITG